jgi:hypothetical protein
MQEWAARMNAKPQHLQDPFLNTLRLEHVPVSLYQAAGKRGACAVNASRAGENGGPPFV